MPYVWDRAPVSYTTPLPTEGHLVGLCPVSGVRDEAGKMWGFLGPLTKPFPRAPPTSERSVTCRLGRALAAQGWLHPWPGDGDGPSAPECTCLGFGLCLPSARLLPGTSGHCACCTCISSYLSH